MVNVQSTGLSKDGNVHYQVGTKAVGSVHRRAGCLSGQEQTRQNHIFRKGSMCILLGRDGFSKMFGENSSNIVMRGGLHRVGIFCHVHASRNGRCLDDTGQTFGQ